MTLYFVSPRFLNVAVLVCIFVLNIAILALSYTSLAVASISAVMAGLTVTNWMALVIITASEMIKMFRGSMKREYARRIHFWTFAILFVDTLPSAIFFSVSTGLGSLCGNFAKLPHSCTFANALLALSWLSPVLAVLGAILVFRDAVSGSNPAVNEAPHPQMAVHHEESSVSVTPSMRIGHCSSPYEPENWPVWTPGMKPQTPLTWEPFPRY
ncbi:hypothetical protein BDZ89DRAFT_1057138 [Hymenopellis radicata]|nr:hypothetical protein BDZ89DRAFT_1057138 [Hymenopellis radicata]